MPNPSASSAGVRPRGSSSSASGLPRVSVTIRSRRRSSSGPVITESSRAPAASLSRPRNNSSGSPASSWEGPRVANRTATGSASNRRATKARACAEARSSHRASSITQSRGCSREASASRLKAARLTTSCAGGAPLLTPNAAPIAARCGLGSRSSRSSIGAHRVCSAANGGSISTSAPKARVTRKPDAASTAYSSSAVLPTPGSPCSTSTRACPPRTTSDSSSSAAHSLDRPSSIDARPGRRLAPPMLKAAPRSGKAPTVNSEDATRRQGVHDRGDLCGPPSPSENPVSTFRSIDSLLDGKTSDQLAGEVAARARERAERDQRSSHRPPSGPADLCPLVARTSGSATEGIYGLVLALSVIAISWYSDRPDA